MGDKSSGEGAPPPPSPLTGAYLLIVLPQTHLPQHKDNVLHNLTKGLITWDKDACHVDLEKELQTITSQAPEGEEAKNGERLIQFASENLVTEVLIHPQLNTLVQCMRNLLSSFTRHRHIIHAGYACAGNGAWMVQDGTYSFADFSDMYQEMEVQRVLRAYENTVTVDIHCCQEGDWNNLKPSAKDSFSKISTVRLNPNDKMSSVKAIHDFLDYLSPYIVSASLEELLESSDVVGNIRFSHPTLYVFPGGQGDAALFGINGFNMLVDGGFSRKACFWDFTRHLDRLDAVLMTRVNNGNIQGLASLLHRKKMEHVYPQIGHFFCNMQERRQPLSPDGDKDKDPLLINLIDLGQEMLVNLRHLQLKPQLCIRDSSMDPINLYHKVGHGKLDMYVLSPSKESRELKDFLAKWNAVDSKIFCSYNKKGGEFTFPLCNRISICALLVWQPANPEDNITRLLFPGSTPQHKIFEGLDRLRNLEFMKHAVCSAKSLSPSSSSIGLSIRNVGRTKVPASTDKIPENEIKPSTKPSEAVKSAVKVSSNLTGITEKVQKQPITSKPAKPKVTEKQKEKPKTDVEIKQETVKQDKIKQSEAVPKEKPKEKPKKTTQKQTEKKIQKTPSGDKKSDSIKSSPTTPKKMPENKLIENAAKAEMKPRASTKTKPSPSATPAKSAKEANNRKVLEQKSKEISKLQKPSAKKEDRKPEKVPPAKKMVSSPSKTGKPTSPIKSAKTVAKQKQDVKKVMKAEKDLPTDSSAVSTPSTVDADLAGIKIKDEGAEKEGLPASDSKSDDGKDAVGEKPTTLSKEEEDEILIIEKIEIDSEEAGKKDVESIAMHIQKGEPKKEIIEKEVVQELDAEEKDKMEKPKSPESKATLQEEIKEDIGLEIKAETELPSKAKLEIQKTESQDTSGTKDIPSLEKIITPKDKEAKEKSGEVIEPKQADESQPDEKFSTTVESGATTTAPTLPEDERIPLDEIKEGIEEKYIKEETKEKDTGIVQRPDQPTSLPEVPKISGTLFDQRAQLLKDIVKTPDEVADLPVHEEADAGIYVGGDTASKELQKSKEDLLTIPSGRKPADKKEAEVAEELKFIKDGLEKEDKSKDLKEDLISSEQISATMPTDISSGERFETKEESEDKIQEDQIPEKETEPQAKLPDKLGAQVRAEEVEEKPIDEGIEEAEEIQKEEEEEEDEDEEHFLPVEKKEVLLEKEVKEKDLGIIVDETDIEPDKAAKLSPEKAVDEATKEEIKPLTAKVSEGGVMSAEPLEMEPLTMMAVEDKVIQDRLKRDSMGEALILDVDEEKETEEIEEKIVSDTMEKEKPQREIESEAKEKILDKVDLLEEKDIDEAEEAIKEEKKIEKDEKPEVTKKDEVVKPLEKSEDEKVKEADVKDEMKDKTDKEKSVDVAKDEKEPLREMKPSLPAAEEKKESKDEKLVEQKEDKKIEKDSLEDLSVTMEPKETKEIEETDKKVEDKVDVKLEEKQLQEDEKEKEDKIDLQLKKDELKEDKITDEKIEGKVETKEEKKEVMEEKISEPTTEEKKKEIEEKVEKKELKDDKTVEEKIETITEKEILKEDKESEKKLEEKQDKEIVEKEVKEVLEKPESIGEKKEIKEDIKKPEKDIEHEKKEMISDIKKEMKAEEVTEKEIEDKEEPIKEEKELMVDKEIKKIEEHDVESKELKDVKKDTEITMKEQVEATVEEKLLKDGIELEIEIKELAETKPDEQKIKEDKESEKEIKEPTDIKTEKKEVEEEKKIEKEDKKEEIIVDEKIKEEIEKPIIPEKEQKVSDDEKSIEKEQLEEMTDKKSEKETEEEIVKEIKEGISIDKELKEITDREEDQKGLVEKELPKEEKVVEAKEDDLGKKKPSEEVISERVDVSLVKDVKSEKEDEIMTEESVKSTQEKEPKSKPEEKEDISSITKDSQKDDKKEIDDAKVDIHKEETTSVQKLEQEEIKKDIIEDKMPVEEKKDITEDQKPLSPELKELGAEEKLEKPEKSETIEKDKTDIKSELFKGIEETHEKIKDIVCVVSEKICPSDFVSTEADDKLTEKSKQKEEDHKKISDSQLLDETAEKVKSVAESASIKEDEKKISDSHLIDEISEKVKSEAESAPIKEEDEKKISDSQLIDETSEKVKSVAESAAVEPITDIIKAVDSIAEKEEHIKEDIVSSDKHLEVTKTAQVEIETEIASTLDTGDLEVEDKKEILEEKAVKSLDQEIKFDQKEIKEKESLEKDAKPLEDIKSKVEQVEEHVDAGKKEEGKDVMIASIPIDKATEKVGADLEATIDTKKPLDKEKAEDKVISKEEKLTAEDKKEGKEEKEETVAKPDKAGIEDSKLEKDETKVKIDDKELKLETVTDKAVDDISKVDTKKAEDDIEKPVSLHEVDEVCSKEIKSEIQAALPEKLDAPKTTLETNLEEKESIKPEETKVKETVEKDEKKTETELAKDIKEEEKPKDEIKPIPTETKSEDSIKKPDDIDIVKEKPEGEIKPIETETKPKDSVTKPDDIDQVKEKEQINGKTPSLDKFEEKDDKISKTMKEEIVPEKTEIKTLEEERVTSPTADKKKLFSIEETEKDIKEINGKVEETTLSSLKESETKLTPSVVESEISKTADVLKEDLKGALEKVTSGLEKDKIEEKDQKLEKNGELKDVSKEIKDVSLDASVKLETETLPKLEEVAKEKSEFESKEKPDSEAKTSIEDKKPEKELKEKLELVDDKIKDLKDSVKPKDDVVKQETLSEVDKTAIKEAESAKDKSEKDAETLGEAKTIPETTSVLDEKKADDKEKEKKPSDSEIKEPLDEKLEETTKSGSFFGSIMEKTKEVVSSLVEKTESVISSTDKTESKETIETMEKEIKEAAVKSEKSLEEVKSLTETLDKAKHDEKTPLLIDEKDVPKAIGESIGKVMDTVVEHTSSAIHDSSVAKLSEESIDSLRTKEEKVVLEVKEASEHILKEASEVVGAQVEKFKEGLEEFSKDISKGIPDFPITNGTSKSKDSKGLEETHFAKESSILESIEQKGKIALEKGVIEIKGTDIKSYLDKEIREEELKSEKDEVKVTDILTTAEKIVSSLNGTIKTDDQSVDQKEAASPVPSLATQLSELKDKDESVLGSTEEKESKCDKELKTGVEKMSKTLELKTEDDEPPHSPKLAEELKEGIKDKLSQIGEEASDKVNGILDSTKEIVEEIREKTVESIGSAISKVGETLGDNLIKADEKLVSSEAQKADAEEKLKTCAAESLKDSDELTSVSEVQSTQDTSSKKTESSADKSSSPEKLSIEGKCVKEVTSSFLDTEVQKWNDGIDSITGVVKPVKSELIEQGAEIVEDIIDKGAELAKERKDSILQEPKKSDPQPIGKDTGKEKEHELLKPEGDTLRMSSPLASLKKDSSRSGTPGSDAVSEREYDLGRATPQSDVSSGQVSRAITHVWETSEGRPESRHYDSDEDVPGSPLSITSHVPSPPQFEYDITKGKEAMTSSFYGSFPGEPSDIEGSSKQAVSDMFASMYVSKYGDLDDPDLPDSDSLTKDEKSGPYDSGFSGDKELDTDYETAVKEHTAARGSTLTGSILGMLGDIKQHITEGISASPPKPGTSQAESAKSDVKKDPIEKWDKPLGLPPPPKQGSKQYNVWNPYKEWGTPLGLPAPAPPPLREDSHTDIEVDTSGSAKTTPKKVSKMNAENNKLALNNSVGKDANNKTKRSDSPVKKLQNKESRKSGVNPVYMDLSYVPHHGNSHYANVEFFKKVRARYYVFSGTEPSKDVFNALLEAKQTWEDKDLEVTIIPTYDTDTLGYWIAENEETLSKFKIDLSPSASRCTINLQDHDTSCSAYRLEF